jgi:hypothetical protein
MASWRLVLDRIGTALAAAGEVRLGHDVEQLVGLCEAQDAEAFLPLRVSELTNLEIPRRVIDFLNLPADIARQVSERGIASLRDIRAASSFWRTGTYFWLGPWQAYVVSDLSRWRRFGRSPLWLEFSGWRWSDEEAKSIRHSQWSWLCERLAPLAQAMTSADGDLPPRLVVGSDRHPVVALMLPTGVERKAVVEAAAGQVGEVHQLLGGEAPPEPRNVPTGIAGSMISGPDVGE